MTKDLQAVLFEPQGDYSDSLAEQRDHIPQFLFRVSAPRTNGNTTSTLVQSAAAVKKLDTSDLLSRPAAAEMLERHCLWRNDMDDNLTSWTSSFLYVIHLAIHRKNHDFGLPESPTPSRIKIYVLEARERPRGTFFGAVSLLKAYGVSNPKLKQDYIHHEYLSQGAFAIPQGEMNVITYQELIDLGLHQLYPPFLENDNIKELLIRVNRLRQLFKVGTPTSPTEKELRIAASIAERWVSCNEMRAVIMATLLSLKPRFRSDPVTMQAFYRTGWCMSSRILATRGFTDNPRHRHHGSKSRQLQQHLARLRARTQTVRGDDVRCACIHAASAAAQ